MIATVAPANAPRAQPPATESGARRLVYLDNLKTILVVGVIAAHAATYYIGGGAWLTHGESSRVTLITLLGVLGLAGGLFWIGLFFLIAGLLAPESITHRGPRRFLRDRLIRLGVPFAVYVLLVMPLLRYAMYAVTYTGNRGPDSFRTWASIHLWPLEAGPLWFVADLLVFSAAYAAWWQLRRRPTIWRGPLRARYLLAMAVAIALTSFVLRLIWPIFTRQFLDLHLSQWPQYVLLFWFGMLSAERGWLVALPDRLWRQCGWAVAVAALAVPILGVTGGALSGQTDLITGGWHWQALGAAGIEGVLAVGGALGLLEYFRRHYDRQGPRARMLTRSSYGAYVVHEPLLISFALAMRPLGLPVEVNFLVLAPAAVVTSFTLAWLLLRLPLVGRIL